MEGYAEPHAGSAGREPKVKGTVSVSVPLVALYYTTVREEEGREETVQD